MTKVTDRALLNRIDAVISEMQAIRALVVGGPSDENDPADPRNKTEDGKLTKQGAEALYRLFDAGYSRYAAARAMGISYGAATHRYGVWQRLRQRSAVHQ